MAELIMWKEIIKHRPKDKEGNYITVKQEHINTVREWLENNKGQEEYNLVKYLFENWEKVDFKNGNEYNLLKMLAQDGTLFNLYK
tara:strand:+ start:193 stop:447 length:255 start_codon:yes stop_codon:yes gene_type:complete